MHVDDDVEVSPFTVINAVAGCLIMMITDHPHILFLVEDTGKLFLCIIRCGRFIFKPKRTPKEQQ